MKTWYVHLLQHPMDGVKRPPHFNELDRRLRPGEEDRVLDAAFEETWSQTFCHDQLVASELQDIEGGPNVSLPRRSLLPITTTKAADQLTDFNTSFKVLATR